MFVIKQLYFAYPTQPSLFDDLSWDFSADENTLIQGENGCGKSTLLKLLTGELRANSGEIISGSGRPFFYVPQDAESRILGLNLEQDLRLWQIAGLKLSLSDLANLPLLQGFDPGFLKLPLRELSTGTKQAYLLSLALLHKDHYLILDEVLTSLDAERKRIFCKELAKHKGILAVSHEDFQDPSIFMKILQIKKARIQ